MFWIISFLIVLISYILAKVWKGFPLADKPWGLWLLGMVGVPLAVALASTLLTNLDYVITAVLGLGLVLVMIRSFRR